MLLLQCTVSLTLQSTLNPLPKGLIKLFFNIPHDPMRGFKFLDGCVLAILCNGWGKEGRYRHVVQEACTEEDRLVNDTPFLWYSYISTLDEM